MLETDVASFADVLSSAEVFLGFHVLVVAKMLEKMKKMKKNEKNEKFRKILKIIK